MSAGSVCEQILYRFSVWSHASPFPILGQARTTHCSHRLRPILLWCLLQLCYTPYYSMRKIYYCVGSVKTRASCLRFEQIALGAIVCGSSSSPSSCLRCDPIVVCASLRCVRTPYVVSFCLRLREPPLYIYDSAQLGEDGLLPATRFMSRVQQHLSHLTLWEKVLKVRRC